MKKRMIIKGHKKNVFVKFWNFCWEIYYKNPEVWNYLIVGFLTTIVNLVVRWGLLFTVLSASNPTQLQVAIVISWICAVAFAYVTNRIFVFKSKSKDYFREIVSFVGGRITTLLIDMGLNWFFVTLLGLDSKLQVTIVTIIIQIIVVILNYLISKIFVFKKEKTEK